MDVVEARAVLGVADADGWDAVRRAYRRLVRGAHPDLVGTSGARQTARLNEAYTVLARAKRAGALTTAAPSPPTPPSPRPPSVGVAVQGTDRLLLAAPPTEAFAMLLEAGHAVGEISYVDRSCAIFEVVVRLAGEACSLVVSLQGRAHGTEAYLTLESLERAASLSPESFLRQMAGALG